MSTPRTIDEARLQANITERAKTLFTEQGYRYEQMAYPFDMIFFVVKPGSRIPFLTGEYYTVTLEVPALNILADCTCECFKHHGICKHYLAVKAAREGEDRWADEQARIEAEISDGRHYMMDCRIAGALVS